MKLLTSIIASTTLLASTGMGLEDKGSKCAANSNAKFAASHAASISEKDIVETALAAGSFNTLAAALTAGDLVEALKGDGPFTVFAPTDAAFAALPKGTLASLLEPKNKATLQAILTYHVVPGSLMAKKVVKSANLTTLNGQRFEVQVTEEGVRIAGANVVKTDIKCSNGTIHVIDRVIMPNTTDILATAAKAGQFKTLQAAIKAASLVEALQAKGPFTVFAPTDEAFAALPAGTLEMLLKPENKSKLAAILKYHVVAGKVFSETAAKGASVATLQGSKITTRSDEHGVFINGARVLGADIQTTNGVIHVIDAVLLPE